jgi:hypothetical protein
VDWIQVAQDTFQGWPVGNTIVNKPSGSIKDGGKAVPWLRSLVSGLSPRRLGFAPGSIHVGFVVDKVALGQVFLRVLRLFFLNISFRRRSPNSYHLGNAEYANVSRHPRLGTRLTLSSGGKRREELPRSVERLSAIKRTLQGVIY